LAAAYGFATPGKDTLDWAKAGMDEIDPAMD
jgi:hypothetical protein